MTHQPHQVKMKNRFKIFYDPKIIENLKSIFHFTSSELLDILERIILRYYMHKYVCSNSLIRKTTINYIVNSN